MKEKRQLSLEEKVRKDFKNKEESRGIPDWRACQIMPPNEAVRKQVKKNWDSIAKPLDGMGSFETLTAKIGAIQNTDDPKVKERAVLIFCADNGIVEEGVSQSGQEVTLAVMKSMARKHSSVGKMAKTAGADTLVVDIGVNTKERVEGVLSCKIRPGTRNFLKEPAMTEEETLAAIDTGIRLVRQCKENGYALLATGEMGIGNTTTSSAVVAALLQKSSEEITGRGAGLSDEGLCRKRQVIAQALEKYDLYHAKPFQILQTVGGLDIAGLVGVCMGGALFQVPIVLDGVISMAAGLLAQLLLPGTVDYLIPSHKGKEPGVSFLLQALSMEPVLDAGLALGEGTGAVLLFPLLDTVMSIYEGSSNFQDIGVEQYVRL